jgi:PAS domain S-box-containing protein
MRGRKSSARIVRQSVQNRALYDFLDRLNIGVAELSKDGHWLNANRSIRKLLGYSSRELLQQSVQNLIQSNRQSTAAGKSESFPAHRKRNTWIPEYWRRKDGSIVRADMFLTVLDSRNRARLLMLLDAKRLNEEDYRKTQEIEKALVLILEAVNEGYWDWNCVTGNVFYGPGWVASLGYSSSDLSHDESFWESIIHPDDLPVAESELHKNFREEAPELRFECRMRSKTGHFKWFLTRGKVVEWDAKQRPARMVGTIADVDESRRDREDLAKSQAELAAIFETTSTFIWSVNSTDFGLLTYNKTFEDQVAQVRGIKLRPGVTPGELGSPDAARRWIGFYERALTEGHFAVDDETFGNGRILHLTFQQMARHGRVFGVSVIGQDVTDRKRVENELRKSEEKFSKTFKQSPVSMTLTSLRDHRYLDVNETFEKITGYQREEVIGKTPFDIGLWVNPQARLDATKQLQETGMLREFELRFRTNSGEIREGLGTGELIEIDGEPCMLSVTSDVTDRKRALEALRDSEERLRLAVASGRMYAFEWDLKTDLVKHSAEASATLGFSEHEVSETKQEFIRRIHAEDRDRVVALLESLCPEHSSYRITYRLLRPDGKTLWLEEWGRQFFDEEGNPQRVVGMVADVTDARQSERALRELSGRLINSQEEERRRIARELHDNIGQELALLAVQAQRIDSGASETEQTTQTDVHELYKRTKDLATKVSKLSHRLHSSELEFLGLGIAVERLCRDFSKQFSVDIDYDLKNIPPKLESNISVCFYRIVQEALQNVVKHSHATRVLLKLMGQQNQLKLMIQDNGSGFNPDAAPFTSGLGLVSMRERIRLVGGQIAVNSRLGHGTTLEASVVAPPQT